MSQLKLDEAKHLTPIDCRENTLRLQKSEEGSTKCVVFNVFTSRNAEFEASSNTMSLKISGSPFDQIRVLEEGWGGPHTQPPSNEVIEESEALWNMLDAVFPDTVERPQVKAGLANFISFTWKRKTPPARKLSVWVFADDEKYAEWHERGKTPGDGIANSMREVIDVVRSFVMPRNVSKG